jgi:hypothetical protein
MSGRQKVVTTELRRMSILSIGLADYGNATSLDYPLASSVSANHVHIFFRMMVNIILKEQKSLGFYSKIVRGKSQKKKRRRVS